MSSNDRQALAQVPTAARWLGGAGLIPFVAGAAALWLVPAVHDRVVADLLVGYAATILAFMGAVHWGLAMSVADGRGMTRWFVAGVVPALVAWCALMLSPLPAIALLTPAFAAVWILDRASIAAKLAPAWYGRLRNALSVAVIASLLAAGIAIWSRLP